MSMMLVDQSKQTVKTLSDDDSRLVRLVLMLPEDIRDELSASLFEKVADGMTNGEVSTRETVEQRGIRIRDYLENMARASCPSDCPDIVDILVDTGRMDEVKRDGGAALVCSTSDAIDDFASEMCSSYEQLVDEDPGYMSVRAMYSTGTQNDVAGEAFFADMRSFIHEWRRVFLERLESESGSEGKSSRKV